MKLLVEVDELKNSERSRLERPGIPADNRNTTGKLKETVTSKAEGFMQKYQRTSRWRSQHPTTSIEYTMLKGKSSALSYRKLTN